MKAVREAVKSTKKARIFKIQQKRDLEKQGTKSYVILYFILFQPNNSIYFLKILASLY